jgi:TldD protein
MDEELLDTAEGSAKLALKSGADYADVRVESIFRTSLRYVNGRFEHATSGVEAGLGVRVLCEGAWGFACTNSFKRKEVEGAVIKAVKMAKATRVSLKQKVSLSPVKAVKDRVLTPVKEPLREVGIDEKMGLVVKAFQVAKRQSSRIVSVTVRYGDASGFRATVTSDGTAIRLGVSRTATGVFVVAKEGEKVVSGYEPIGSVGGFEVYERLSMMDCARRVAKKVVGMLKAKPAPSGRFTVVVDPRLGGVFAHEAVGHACEGDYVMTGYSILHDRLSTQIGSEHVTICDDPTLPDGWGSERYDAEGSPARKRTLIDHGVLKDYILDRESAAKLNMSVNGGSRIQSFAFRPIVRMSNTYIAPGDFSFEEIVEDVDEGVYVKGSMGGQVDPAKGTFQFAAEEAYLIQRGRITTPLLNVSLSGLTLETLRNIDAVAKDLKFYIGSCGKEDQMVPAGDGSPHVRIRNAVVGGRT